MTSKMLTSFLRIVNKNFEHFYEYFFILYIEKIALFKNCIIPTTLIICLFMHPYLLRPPSLNVSTHCLFHIFKKKLSV